MFIVFTFVLNAALNFLLGLAVAAVLGPAEYGRFAVASMVAIVLGTALFDWLRLSATRYYTESVRSSDPQLRSTLDAGYGAIAAVLGVAALAVALLHVDVGLSTVMLLATAAAAIGNARFDFTTALSRARFLERTHAVLVITKNLLAFVLMLGAAFWLHSAEWVMGALALSGLLAILPARAVLRDAGAPLRRAHAQRFAIFARYGYPIVAANVIYQVIVLANRSAAAAKLGFAEAGQLSLATDMSIRLLLAVGAALDVYLFQVVVRRDAAEGRAAAHAQVVRNMLIVGAVLVLLATGYAAAMPAFEALVVPAKFRADFGSVSLVLVPGILAFCLVNFALNPVFQLGGRTGPLVLAAVAALGADLGGLALLPSSSGVLGYATVHSGSLLLGSVLTAALAFRTAACRPRLRDVGAILLAGVAAALAIWPTRSLGHPLAALIAAMLAGPPVYLAVLYRFDVAGFRFLVTGTFARLRSKMPQKTRLAAGRQRHV